MKSSHSRIKSQRGFTLAEILIALILLTAITMLMLNISKPWFNLKAEMDTSSRLGAIESALLSLYEPAAFTMETPTDSGDDGSWMALASPSAAGVNGKLYYGNLTAGDATLGPLKNAFTYTRGQEDLSAVLPQGCRTEGTLAFWRQLPGSLSLRPDTVIRDGHGAPICLLLGPQRFIVNGGMRIYYHQMYAVTAGNNGRFDVGSKISAATGALSLSGDDRGIVISGLDLQQKKFLATQQRLQNAASVYERYFSMRYLATNTREVMTNYFVDGGGPVGEFVLGDALLTKDFFKLRVSADDCPGKPGVACSLNTLGIVGVNAESAWENYPATAIAGVSFSRTLYMANQVDHNVATSDESQIRVPIPFPGDTASLNSPPFTALVFVFLPGPMDSGIPRLYGISAYGRY